MEMKRTKDERPPLNEYVLGVWPTASPIPEFTALKRKRSGEYVNRHNEPVLAPKFWLELPTLPQ